MVDKRLVDNLVQEERQRANNLEQKLRDSERENQALRKADFGLRRDRDALRKEVGRLRTWQVGLVEMEKERDNAVCRADAAEAALVEVLRDLKTVVDSFDCTNPESARRALRVILNRAEPKKELNNDNPNTSNRHV